MPHSARTVKAVVISPSTVTVPCNVDATIAFASFAIVVADAKTIATMARRPKGYSRSAFKGHRHDLRPAV